MPGTKHVGNLVAIVDFRTKSLAELGAILERDVAKLKLYADAKYESDCRFATHKDDIQHACQLARSAIYVVLGLHYKTILSRSRHDKYHRDWSVYDVSRAAQDFPSDTGLAELDLQLHRIAPGITFSLAQYSEDGHGMYRSPDLVCFPTEHLRIYFKADISTANGGKGLISARAVGYTGRDSLFQNTIFSHESVWNSMWCEDKQVESFIAYVDYYVHLVANFESVRSCCDLSARKSALTTLRRMFNDYDDMITAWPCFSATETGVSIALKAPDVVLSGTYEGDKFSFDYSFGASHVSGTVELSQADAIIQAFQNMHRQQDLQ